MSAPHAVEVGLSPWTAKQRLVLLVLLALGVAGLTAGYAGTSGTLKVADQVGWVNVAGAALLVSGAGVVLFLTTGRKAIGLRRLGLFGNLAVEEANAVDGSMGVASGELVAAATMTKYHRADCSFVAGKPGLVAASAADHQQAGRRPCGVCLPGGDA